MNSAEAMLFHRNENEITMLRECVERMSRLSCMRIASGETLIAPDDCKCPACYCKECLETVMVMHQVYQPMQVFDA